VGSKFRPVAANLPRSSQSACKPSFTKIISSCLALIFHLLYHQFAWAYNIVARIASLGMWYQWVNAALPFLDYGPVLELGFGTGHLICELSDRGINVVGLDKSMHMAKLSRSSLRKIKVTSELVNGSAQYLPFTNQHFQKIVSTFPSPFILERLTLLEIWRVILPGGQVVIIPAAWITGASLWYKLAALLFRVTHQTPPIVSDLDDAFSGLRNELEAIGFKVQQRIVELPQSKVLCILAERPLSTVKSYRG
jgi:ubiquinone/menaquinone biosynthesis C-methylase UbiE